MPQSTPTNQYLFLFTIGPVQSFIAQARKTRDLYAGSLLLSDLIKEAMEYLNKTYDVKPNDFIFPRFDLKSKSESNPNRIVALVNHNAPEKLGAELEVYLRATFIEKAKGILNYKGINRTSFPEFEAQIKDFLNVYWVMVPYDGNKETYKSKFEEAERFLGAVKNIRVFEQRTEVGGRKDSMSGERNALFYSKYRKDKLRYMDVATKVPSLTLNEGLSAIGLLKRFYKKKDTDAFSSTAKIALLDTLDAIDKKMVNSYLNGIKKRRQSQLDIDVSDIDEQLLFRSNLNRKYFEKNGLKEAYQGISFLSDALARVEQAARDKNKKWHTYYATIIFDGDNMGKWLSGAYLKDQSELLDFHQTLSKLLASYAKWATQYIDGKGQDGIQKGKTVYAGGDDFMGFICLPHLFPTLKKLRVEFEEQVNKALHQKFDLKNKRFSFSAGVTIAHYKEALSGVIRQTRNFEQQAKDVDGKDAITLGILKHSGNTLSTSFKWQDREDWLIDYLQKVIDYLEQDFSNTFILQLRKTMFPLVGVRSFYIDDMLETELKRLLSRAYKEQKKDKQKIEDLHNVLMSLYKAIKRSHDSTYDQINVFFDLLNICDFINRKTKNDN